VHRVVQDLQLCSSEGFCATDELMRGRKFGEKYYFIYVFGEHSIYLKK